MRSRQIFAQLCARIFFVMVNNTTWVETFSCALAVNSEKRFRVMRCRSVTGAEMCYVYNCTYVERAHVAIDNNELGL